MKETKYEWVNNQDQSGLIYIWMDVKIELQYKINYLLHCAELLRDPSIGE